MSGVKLQDHLEPRGSSDFYLLEDIYMKGGLQVTYDRSSIPLDHRKFGMLVYEQFGKLWQLTALPDTWEVRTIDALPNMIVFRPNGTSAGNVYASFQDLYEAFEATSGIVNIILDPIYIELGQCTVSTGDVHDFKGRANFIGIAKAGVGPVELVISGEGTVIKNPRSFANITVSPKGDEAVATLVFDIATFSGCSCYFIDSLLSDTNNPGNVAINADTIIYALGSSLVGLGTTYISDNVTLRVYAYDSSTVDGYCTGGTGSTLSHYLCSTGATVYHRQTGPATYNFYIQPGLYETYYYKTSTAAYNNKFKSTTLSQLLTNLTADSGVKELVLYSNLTLSANLSALNNLTIKTHPSVARVTLTISSAAVLSGVGKLENINVVFGSTAYSNITTPMHFVGCTMAVSTGKKGLKISSGDNGLYFDRCSVGNTESDEGVICTLVNLGSASALGTVQATHSLIGPYAFKGGSGVTVTVSKNDPGTVVDTPVLSGVTVNKYRSFEFSGDIYGDDTGIQAVRGLYRKDINADAASPTDKTMLLYITSDSNYHSTPMFQDYMVAASDPTIAQDPEKPFAEVGESIINPTFAITYTPGPSVVPALTYDHLTDADGGGHNIDIITDPESPTVTATYGPKTYDQTVSWTITCRRGYGPVERAATTTTKWVNKVYYGASDAPEVYDETFIKGLASSVLSDTAYRTITGLNPTGNKHIYYACRTAYALTEDNFWIDGFCGCFTKKPSTVVVHTANDTTGTEYDIWESNQVGLGSCTVTVQ